jgi:hypothetical protein
VDKLANWKFPHLFHESIRWEIVRAEIKSEKEEKKELETSNDSGGDDENVLHLLT